MSNPFSWRTGESCLPIGSPTRGPTHYGELDPSPSLLSVGDRIEIQGITYSRIALELSGTIRIDFTSNSYKLLLKRVAQLISTEIFYTSSVSALVFSYFTSAVIRAVTESVRSHLTHDRTGNLTQFTLCTFSRNPCIRTDKINTLKIEKRVRGFSIPASLSSSGLVQYSFSSNCNEFLPRQISSLKEDLFHAVEDQEGKLLGTKSSKRVWALRRTIDHFELQVYLKELQIVTTHSLLRGSSLPVGRLPLEPAQEDPSSPSPIKTSWALTKYFKKS